MKTPFIFRQHPNMLFSFLAAMFAAKNMTRDIDPEDRKHEGSPNKIAPHRAEHCISKKERKRREHIRRINPNRKH